MIEEREFDPEQDELDVEMHRWARAESTQSIGTGGLNTCIGIAIMDDRGGRAWVLHSPNINNDPDGFRAMLQDAASSTGSSPPRIVLTGGDISDPVCRSAVHQDRRLAETYVRELFPDATPKVCWSAVEGFMLDYRDGTWVERGGSPHFS